MIHCRKFNLFNKINTSKPSNTVSWAIPSSNATLLTFPEEMWKPSTTWLSRILCDSLWYSEIDPRRRSFNMIFVLGKRKSRLVPNQVCFFAKILHSLFSLRKRPSSQLRDITRRCCLNILAHWFRNHWQFLIHLRMMNFTHQIIDELSFLGSNSWTNEIIFLTQISLEFERLHHEDCKGLLFDFLIT